jgi:hypothetical protein
VSDRTRIVVLAVVTVPLAWFALQHDSGTGSATSSGRPAARPAAAAPAPAAALAPMSAPPPSATVSSGPAGSAASSAPVAAPQVVKAGTGTLLVVPGSSPASGPGKVHRYTVSVEEGLGVDAADVAAQVQRTLADPRSWGGTGKLAFQRVDSGPVDLRVVLASPRLTDRMCAPLRTLGTLSCGNGTTAVINSFRWLTGADAYTGRLAEYREYVVNHEVGHTIGHGHEPCPGPGQPAPVMMQQTKGVGACRPSPWPYP